MRLLDTGPGSQVCAVVVLYRPEADALSSQLTALAPQVGHVVVVDNGSDPGTADRVMARFPSVRYVCSGSNLGIAAAQNLGLGAARAIPGVQQVLLMDQDSVPEPGMVARLLGALEAARAAGVRVGAAGPLSRDARTGHSAFLVTERADGWPARRYFAELAPVKQPVECAFLIASGTLIPLAVLDEVGAMRARYFIDHVDTEWCFRCRQAGYSLLGVPDAVLTHRLGDSVRRVWFFGWRHVASHSPLRDYYMFRNTLLMLRDLRLGWRWRLHFLMRLVQFAGFFIPFGGQAGRRVALMSRGLRHGLMGQGGRLAAGGKTREPLPLYDYDPDRRNSAR